MPQYVVPTVEEVNLTGNSLIDRLLFLRGIKTKEEAEVFLKPSYERDIGNPFEIYGMEKAVKRILKALKGGEKVAIYSDYDCDGIPGGALLSHFFDTIGYTNRIHYIPHRHNEGYGLHKHAIDSLHKEGASLIITVDLAITNIEEVAYAKEKGIDVIVTDHHLPLHDEKGNQVVPDAYVVVNSKQEVCTYADDMLCGCALAWKLACALLLTLRKEKEVKKNGIWKVVVEKAKGLPEGWEKWLLDLAALSTIADMVPLKKENRAIAHFGLKVLRKSPRPGIQKMLSNAGTLQKNITEDDISFSLAPRINAASRMDDPRVAFKALASLDLKEALTHASLLETLNTKRKQDVGDVLSQISYDHSHFGEDIIFVGDTSWTPGILGLIAQRILEETGKPVFVWGVGEDEAVAKGSCRSNGDVHVVDLMTKVKEYFLGVGGHEEAGGFSFIRGKEDEIRNALNEAYKTIPKKQISNDVESIDDILSLDDIKENFFKELEMLAPFGVGNPKPLFAFKNIRAHQVKAFGKQANHLEVLYKNSQGKTVQAILFGKTPKDFPILDGEHTLLAHIERNTFAGKNELRLRIKDIVERL